MPLIGDLVVGFLVLVGIAILVLLGLLLLGFVVGILPVISVGTIGGAVVGAAIGFLTGGSLPVSAAIGAGVGPLVTSVFFLDGAVVDKPPLYGAMLGGLGGLLLTAEPLFPALMAVAGACAGAGLAPPRLETAE